MGRSGKDSIVPQKQLKGKRATGEMNRSAVSKRGGAGREWRPNDQGWGRPLLRGVIQYWQGAGGWVGVRREEGGGGGRDVLCIDLMTTPQRGMFTDGNSQ